MSKAVVFDVEARQGLKRGIDIVANTVRITLAPKGRNVVLEKKFGAPTGSLRSISRTMVTPSLVTVENAGAQLLREVATKTNDVLIRCS